MLAYGDLCNARADQVHMKLNLKIGADLGVRSELG